MAFVTCPFQFRMGLGCAPAFRRHCSEEPVSEAAALAAAALTRLRRPVLHLISADSPMI